MAPQGRNEAAGNNKKARRSRKKRRTEDFSSDSDSDNVSISEHEEVVPSKPSAPENVEAAVTIEDIDIESDTETKGLAPEPLNNETRQKLAQTNFTTTSLSTSTGFGKNVNNVAEIQATLDKDRAKLDSDYLMLMAQEFSDDIEELRKKPDFGEKSIVVLAKALQSGSNMFDKNTLAALTGK